MLKKFLAAIAKGTLAGMLVSLLAFSAAPAADFSRKFTSTTGDVAGSIDNLKCSTIGSKNGFGTVTDSTGAVEFWTFDYQATDTADSTHIRCKGYTTSGVWEFLGSVNQDLSTNAAVTFLSAVLTNGITADTFVAKSGETGNGGFEIDNQPNTDQTCQGNLTTVQSGQDSVTFRMVMALDSDGTYIAANADSTSPLPAKAIACNTADDGDPLLVMLEGYIRDDVNWDFTGDIQKDMLLDDTAGGMILFDDGNIPAAPGDLRQIIGYVTLTATKEVLYFDPQPVYVVLE